MKKLMGLLLLALFGFLQVQAQPILIKSSLGGSSVDVANSIAITPDGGYVVAGESESSDGDVSSSKGDNDYWIVKLDAFGGLEWERSYGGSHYDVANSIAITSDGGYVVAGTSQSGDGDRSEGKGIYDVWIIKLDAFGEIEWERSYGSHAEDGANSIAITPDGGYVVAGQNRASTGDVGENNGRYDYWILKLDAFGDLEWERSYGGSGDERANSIAITPDGGYVVAGVSESSDGDVSSSKGDNDYWIVKLDALGDLEWERSYGGSGNDMAYSIVLAPEGGYVVTGGTGSFDGDVSNNKGNTDYWILKLDAFGDLEWERSYGGSATDVAKSIAITSDGGYVVGGYSFSFDGDVSNYKGNTDYWILKLDAFGELEWERSYGGSHADEANSIAVTSDGDYVVAGWSYSSDGDVSENNGEADYWIIKLGCSEVEAGFTHEVDGTNIIFNSNTVSSVTSYSWTANGQSIGSSSSITVPLSQVNLKEVCLEVSNGCASDIYCETEFKDCTELEASFSYDLEGSNVILNSTTVSSSVLSYSWKVNGQSIGTSSSITIPKSQVNLKEVCLEVMDECDNESIVCKTIAFPNNPSPKIMAGGGAHSLMVCDNGDVYSCGQSSFGQLGQPINNYILNSTNINLPCCPPFIFN